MGFRSLIQPDPRWRGYTGNTPAFTLVVFVAVLANLIFTCAIFKRVKLEAGQGHMVETFTLFSGVLLLPIISLIVLAATLVLHGKHNASPKLSACAYGLFVVGWLTIFSMETRCVIEDDRVYYGDKGLCMWVHALTIKLAVGRIVTHGFCILGFLLLFVLSILANKEVNAGRTTSVGAMRLNHDSENKRANAPTKIHNAKLEGLLKPDPRWRGCTSNVPPLTLVILAFVLVNLSLSIVIVPIIYRRAWSWGHDSIPLVLLAEVTVPLISLIHLMVFLVLHQKHKASPLVHLILSFMLLVGWCTEFGIAASCNLVDIEHPNDFRGYRGETVCRWWTSYPLSLARGRMAFSFLCLLGYLCLASMSGWTLFRVKEKQRFERKVVALKMESLRDVEVGEIHLPDGSHWVNMTVHVPLVEAPNNPVPLVEAPGSTRLAEELDSEPVWEGDRKKIAHGPMTGEPERTKDNKERPPQPIQVGSNDGGRQGQVPTSVYEM